MIRAVRFVPASFASSAAMSAFSCARWRLTPSRPRLSWSTATLTATTPARGYDDDPCDSAREAALLGGAHSMLLAA